MIKTQLNQLSNKKDTNTENAEYNIWDIWNVTNKNLEDYLEKCGDRHTIEILYAESMKRDDIESIIILNEFVKKNNIIIDKKIVMFYIYISHTYFIKNCRKCDERICYSNFEKYFPCYANEFYHYFTLKNKKICDVVKQ